MSNNLRQIAKDLRSFVKRCKDVHYSDSLLITFLVTGLLTTFAPKSIYADAAGEQQEVSAETYEAITDLRQTFLRAKKENEKSLKGANTELAQLLKQGDQVVKSPWASFQFGTGYQNNDWLTTYKGRGGKNLQYYSRTNDLTKYVFDTNKHEYGATNLHIKRNKEPDALTINPANVYKAYVPSEVVKMNAMTLPNAPTFDPSVVSPAARQYGKNINVAVNTRSIATPTATNLNYDAANNANAYGNTGNTVSNSASTFNLNAGSWKNTNNLDNSPTQYNSQTWNTGMGTVTTGSSQYVGGPIVDLSGDFYMRSMGYISHTYADTDGVKHSENIVRPYWYQWHTDGNGKNGNWYDNLAGYNHARVNGQELPIISGGNHDTGWGGNDLTFEGGTYGKKGDITVTSSGSQSSVLVNTTNAAKIWRSTFGVGSTSSDTSNYGATKSSGIYVETNKQVVVEGGARDYKNIRTVFTDGTWDNGRGLDNMGNKIYAPDGTLLKTIKGYAEHGYITDEGIQMGATTRKTGTYFYVNGKNNNGIYSNGGTVKVNPNGATEGGVTFNLSTNNNNNAYYYDSSSQNNNGIFMNGGDADVRYATFNVNNEGNGLLLSNKATGSTTGGTFNVNGGQGIYIDSGSTATSGSTVTDVNGTTFNVAGSSNNGIYVKGGHGDLQKVTNSTFNVSGTNSNGVYKDTSKDTAVSGSTFTVSGAGSTGITYDGGSAAETISGSRFTVSGGSSSAGILMSDATQIKISPSSYFNVSNASIGIDVDNNGLQAKEIQFLGDSTSLAPVHMTLTGDSNTGVNISGGYMNGGTDANKKVKLTKDSKAGLDMTIKGNHNVGYNNRNYANELIIDSANNPININSASGFGRIIIGDTTQGYNNNVIFANQGYVKTGKVNLKHIEVDGNNNTVAFFKQGTGGYFDSDKNSTGNGVVGFFGTSSSDELEFQGIIGNNYASDGNVGIYAASGQRKGLNTWGIIGDNSVAARNTVLEDLRITNLNIAAGPKATNTVLAYATNGTKMTVANTNTTANGALITNTISDGGYYDTVNSKNVWGYAVPYHAISNNTTMFYSKGVWDNSTHKFGLNFPAGTNTSPTEIIVKNPVDMVSKTGTAYYANDGGKVTVEETTRAGGYNSIIAYASGQNTAANGSAISNSGTYTTMKGTTGQTTNYGSIVEIKKGITAADNMLFSANTATGRILGDESHAYSNIGGYALNNGNVIIKGTTANGSTKEGSDTAAADTAKSLIYGLGAYASGKGSNVIFDSSGSGAAATVVTGTNGALYAENGGYVEFAGEIIHQNNAPASVSTGASGDGAGITSTAESRGGRNISSSISNDHTNVQVFYVKRTSGTDDAGITFNNATKIDMYDGYFLTGNEYQHRPDSINDYWNNSYSDYYKEKQRTAANGTAWDRARYRGMSNVTLNLVKGGDIDLGLINQAENTLKWNSDKDKTAGTYLPSIATYAGMASINNGGTSNKESTSTVTKFSSSIINSTLEVSDANIELENYAISNPVSGVKSEKNATTMNDTAVDPFNNIKMESTKVNITSAAKIYGDIGTLNGKSLLAGQGLNMANSLYRWDKLNDDNSAWVKTDNTQSGYTNEGIVSVWGGTSVNPITGINVAYGTIENKGSTAKVVVDHGFGIAGTDDSILKNNEGKIFVTGKYDPSGQNTIANTSLTSTKSLVVRTTGAETAPTGKNYGIVGISTNNVTEHSTYGGKRYGNNKVTIENKDGIVEVDGELAVGIYAENVNQSGAVAKNDEHAQKSNVTISYDNQNAASADAIKVNYGAGVAGGTTTTKENKNLHGVGIALVEKNKDTIAANRGGIITLNTKNNGIGATADILTYQNGIGIYGESSDIKFKTDSTGLTVDTGSEGAGIWVTDDSNISSESDRLATPKTLNYNYKGYNDKKGFGMIFGSTMSGVSTDAKNYLDIKFNNNNDTSLTLTTEKTQTSPGTITAGKGTTRGIAGMLVNTDANDSVYNYGDIKEDTSKTNVRAYGAVVNKGRLVNYGNIELNDSLNVDASSVEKADLKKVNAGILANDHDTASNTWIENYGDIKVGTTSRKNIGGFGIYGYNIITGEKADHTTSTITVNSNSYGIYSGDGTVKVQKGTKLLVGNDTVLGHVQTTTGKAITTNPSKRQSTYSQASELLPGRTTDAAYGVYIGDNSLLSGGSRNVEVSADMDIDRYSYGIVLAKNTNAEAGGTNGTTVKIGDGNYTLDASGKVSSLTPTNAPTIVLAANKNAGGLVISTAPSTPKVPEEVDEQGNAVYYYSADKNSKATSFANVTMNGDYNTAYYTAGSVDNFGTIDLRSQNNLLTVNGSSSANLGYGNVGIVSTNPNVASTNYGTIITSMSDTANQKYSAGMAAGRNVYNDEGKFVRFEDEGYVVNRGTITVSQDEGIGMFATGTRSKAVNYGTIDLQGKKSIGMYLDQGAQGENYGTITGDAEGIKGVVAINNGYIKNYGTIKVTGASSVGIITDNINVKTDNEDPSKYNGGTEEGKAEAIKYVSAGDEKTTGVGTTIKIPDTVPLAKVTVDGIDTPIFDVESDAAASGDWAKNITVNSSIQTGGTRIIDLNTKDEWGNPAWPHHNRPQLSEVTSVGMYVDTSGVRYTNPINGLEKLSKLSEVNLYFGTEATLYTNSKAIRIGDKVDDKGNVIKSNILKPFNDALSNLAGGAIVNPLSASLTWQVKAKPDANNQLTEIYLSKVPYHSFAFDNDKSLVNFTNNLDNLYEIARPGSSEKMIFNKLNSLGNGEGHILAQAFDQMRGHIHGGIQQRINVTSNILTDELAQLRNEGNASKDSNKIKAFGRREEYKTDTAGIPDWHSNAGGFVYLHEDETVKLGDRSGWYAGAVNNYFTFRDLARSYENQAMLKAGLFKQTPLDENGTFTFTIGGDAFLGKTNNKRRFFVIDKEFRAKSDYYTYGADINARLEKEFPITAGFSIVPNVGLDFQYGRFSTLNEEGDMALKVKSNDYYSVKPNAGVDFKYTQPVFKKSNFVASIGLSYETELGKLSGVENEAKIKGAWTDYYTIKGDKENRKGNFKSDLKLGLDNGRLGFTVNTGFDTKGHNFKAGLGLRALF